MTLLQPKELLSSFNTCLMGRKLALIKYGQLTILKGILQHPTVCRVDKALIELPFVSTSQPNPEAGSLK
jgi:hypothetical protein